MPLSEKDIQLFADLEHTFNTPGWTRLIEGWKEERDWIPLAAFHSVKTIEELNEWRVRLKLLDELIALADDMRQQREALEENEDESENV